MGMNKILRVYLSYFFFCSYLCLEAKNIKFVEKFTIGSEEREEEIFFRIIDAKSDLKGNIFILDYANNCIKKFSKDGKFLNEVVKKGQGPGEMTRPAGIDINQEGIVFINDYGNRRINVYNNDLNYISSIRLDPSLYIEDIYITPEGNLLILRSPRIVGEKYFNLFNREGTYICAFFDELHPFAPNMQSIKEIRNYMTSFFYLIGKANSNQDKTRIAFTHEVPENPYKIYLLDIKGNFIKIIKKTIKEYNPKKRQEYFARLPKDKGHVKESYTYVTIGDLHFALKNYLIVQRIEEIYKSGTFTRFLTLLDIFSLDGDLVCEGMDFNGEILSVDQDNNVYARMEDEHGISKLVVYSLKINL